jgi:hypothetical protein
VTTNSDGESPEAAAAFLGGGLLAVSTSPDERMAVVVKSGRLLPRYVLCGRVSSAWSVIDWDDIDEEDERASNPHFTRADHEAIHGWFPTTTWTSTVTDKELAAGAPNVGMDFSRGLAPQEASRVVLRAGAERLIAPVIDGVYWIVRWNVDPNDETAEIEFEGFELD